MKNREIYIMRNNFRERKGIDAKLRIQTNAKIGSLYGGKES